MNKREIINRLKSVTGVSDWSLFKKNLHKRIGKLIWKKKYSANDILQKMISMGMKPGDIVFIHSSMKEFYNYVGSPEELISLIINYLGKEGTLMMPAYPKNFSSISKTCLSENYHGINDEIKFDVKNTPTGAGYLAEVFRKMPGVKRSINLQHSTCAIGKQADYLLSEHHLSNTCWDEKSPYYKMTVLDAKVFSFGLPYFISTVIHCTDSLLYGKYEYYNSFFQKQITYNYKDYDGNIGVHTMRTIGVERHRNKKKMIKKYFAKDQFRKEYISNLRIELVNAKYTHERFMELAKQGIVMYSEPNPKKYSWKPIVESES